MIYNEKEIKILRDGGKRLAFVLNKVKDFVRTGVTTKELDTLAERLIREEGDTPALLGYKPSFSDKKYPASLCISVNDEVVHGIPGERKLEEGDIVGLDLVIKHNGLYVDSAVTVAVGEITEQTKELMTTTEKSLYAGIAVAHAGNHIGDIGAAIAKVVKGTGFGIVEDLAGHGVGHQIHEDPFIPNFGHVGTGIELKSGMVLALEPMLNEGTKYVSLSEEDGYTYSTKDHKKSAHFEHTILITKGVPEVLTKL